MSKKLWVERMSSNGWGWEPPPMFAISETENYWDEPIEVEDTWWDKYKELARQFSEMQLEAARLAGYKIDE